MAPSSTEVKQIFAPLEVPGKQGDFWAVVADDVDWEIPGHSPMSGKYTSKEQFLSATIEVLGNQVLKEPLRIKVDNAIGGGDSDWVVVEMHSVDAECRNGMTYDMRYCWVCRFKDNKIVQVRAYIDTDLLTQAVEQNP